MQKAAFFADCGPAGGAARVRRGNDSRRMRAAGSTRNTRRTRRRRSTCSRAYHPRSAGEGGWRIEDAAQGEVLVHVSDETVMETGYELAVGDYVYVDYDGAMTRSLPPQVTAGRIVSHKLEGDVLETLRRGERPAALRALTATSTASTCPRRGQATGFDAQRAIAYYDGAATLSIPPQVSAGLVQAGVCRGGRRHRGCPRRP